MFPCARVFTPTKENHVLQVLGRKGDGVPFEARMVVDTVQQALVVRIFWLYRRPLKR